MLGFDMPTLPNITRMLRLAIEVGIIGRTRPVWPRKKAGGMRHAALCRYELVLIITLLVLVTLATSADAQERSKVEIVPKVPHLAGVTAVAFAPDGALVASASGDNTLKLWDAVSGQLVRTFEGHSQEVVSVAFSPDGVRLLSGSYDATIKLWDAATGQLVRTFVGHSDRVYSAAFSPDGARVVSGSEDKTLKLWETTTGALLRTFPAHSRVYSVAFAPDGARVVFGCENKSLKVWDAVSGQLVRAFAGHSNAVASVAFSPDGARVVSASLDRTLKVWDAASGELVRTLSGHSGSVMSVAFSPDDTRVVSGSYGKRVELWDTSTWQLLRTFEETASVLSVAFSPDGRRLLAGSHDATLKLWDAASGELVRTFDGHTEGVTSVAFSPDGERMVAGSEDNALRLWNATTGELLRAFDAQSRVYSVAFSPDAARVVSGSWKVADSWDKALRLWDTATGQLVRTLQGHSSLATAVFSPDGARVLSGSWDKTLKLWDAGTGQLLGTFSGHSGPVNSVAFSPDGIHAVSGSEDKTVKLWNVATGQLVGTLLGHSDQVISVAFSPDGSRVASGSWDTKIKLWDVTTGRLVRSFVGHSKMVTSVAFSSDGTRLLSGSWDRTLKLWESATGKLVRTFEGHSGRVASVAFSPSGRSLLSGSLDSTTKIWNLETAQLQASLLAARDGGWVTITPGGFYVASRRDPDMLTMVRKFETTSVAQVADHLYRPDLVQERLKGDPELKYDGAAKYLDLGKILDSGQPPQIETVPGRKTERTHATVRLAARLVDTGGGINDKVVWRVNGITQGELTTVGGSGSYRIAEQTLQIDPSRRNIIEVTAYNKAGLLASLPLRFEVDRYVTTAPRPKMHLLAIGVSKYALGEWKLDYAAKDAATFAKTLREAAEPIYDKVSVTVLSDGEATLKNIEATFRAMKDQVGPADVFVLFVAGHGRNPNGTYYFIPQDLAGFTQGRTLKSHAVGQDQWQAWLAMIPAQKSVLVFDTCESSAAAGLSRDIGRARETAMDRLRFATGRSVITAARQAAHEGYKGHGVLTYAILEALAKREGGGDEVDLVQLAAHIDLKVPEFSQELTGEAQRPHFKIEGNFPIGVRKTGILGGGSVAAIPATPTHVVIRIEPLRLHAAADAPIQRNLDPGTLVRVVDLAGDWALIAREGQKLGYVPLQALVRIQ